MTPCRNLAGISGIYCIIHRGTGLCYVGSSINIGKRRYEHIYDSRHGSTNRFHIALRAFGEDAFDFEVLEECPQELLMDRERFYIVFTGAASIDGFNTRSNPNATYDHVVSDVTRARISASKKAQNRKLTPEQKEMVRISSTGRIKSAECRAKMSAAHAGKKKSDEHRANLSKSRTGWKMDETTKAKISAAFIGREFSEESKQKMSVSTAATRARRRALGLNPLNNNRGLAVLTDNWEWIEGFACPKRGATTYGLKYSSMRYYLLTENVYQKRKVRFVLATVIEDFEIASALPPVEEIPASPTSP